MAKLYGATLHFIGVNTEGKIKGLEKLDATVKDIKALAKNFKTK
jgi:hypothetical protein